MSVVKSAAKTSLIIFSFLVVIIVGGAIFFYINMDSIAKQLTEKFASDALGVPVSVGSMDINIEGLKVSVRDIRIANPAGYKKKHAIIVDSVDVTAKSFATDLLTFSNISVGGTEVNLEVSQKGSNLGDLKGNVDANSAAGGFSQGASSGANMKVIVESFFMSDAKVNPSVTLIGGDLISVDVPDIKLRGIGQKENGVVAQDAIAQVMKVVLQRFNDSAAGAGFLKGVSIDALKEVGLNKVKDKLKGVVPTKDINEIKDGVKALKGLFE